MGIKKFLKKKKASLEKYQAKRKRDSQSKQFYKDLELEKQAEQLKLEAEQEKKRLKNIKDIEKYKGIIKKSKQKRKEHKQKEMYSKVESAAMFFPNLITSTYERTGYVAGQLNISNPKHDIIGSLNTPLGSKSNLDIGGGIDIWGSPRKKRSSKKVKKRRKKRR